MDTAGIGCWTGGPTQGCRSSRLRTYKEKSKNAKSKNFFLLCCKPALRTVASPVTLVSTGVVPAAEAGARPLLALLGMAIALTRPAVGEAPVSRLAAITALAERSGPTLAQARKLVAEARHGALQAATAGCKR